MDHPRRKKRIPKKTVSSSSESEANITSSNESEDDVTSKAKKKLRFSTSNRLVSASDDDSSESIDDITSKSKKKFRSSTTNRVNGITSKSKKKLRSSTSNRLVSASDDDSLESIDDTTSKIKRKLQTSNSNNRLVSSSDDDSSKSAEDIASNTKKKLRISNSTYRLASVSDDGSSKSTPSVVSPSKNVAKKSTATRPNTSQASTSANTSHCSPYPKRDIEKRFYSPLKKKIDVLSKEDEIQLVNNCIHYLLIIHQKNHSIKKSEIAKHGFKNSVSAKNVDGLIKIVNQKLQQVFGLELMDVGDKSKEYMIYNPLHESSDFAAFSDKELAEKGLITYILTIIFMNGKSVLEKDLWMALEPFGLTPDCKKHPHFGDVKKFITQELVHQMYLKYIKILNSEPIEHELKWGERARWEVNKGQILDLACEIYGDCTRQDWIIQNRSLDDSD